MNLNITKSSYAQLEPALAEILTLLHGERVNVFYTGQSSAPNAIPCGPCAAFQTPVGEVVLSVPGWSAKESYLSIVQKIAHIDESEQDIGGIRFTGFCKTPQSCHRYSIFMNNELGEKSSQNVFVALRNNCISELNLDKCGSSVAEQFLTIPLRLRLLLNGVFISGKKKLTCSLGNIHLPHREEDFGVYVYFSYGGLEMTVCQKNKIRTTFEPDALEAGPEIEFVLESFELSLADALSLRPGDTIKIDTNQKLQGIIRIGGGDWVQGTLCFTEEGAFIDLTSFSKKETFSLNER